MAVRSDTQTAGGDFEGALQRFIRRLQRAPHNSMVFNPYRFRYLRDNLAHYLRFHYQAQSSLLLVGEALGFRGGRLTGLPFSSGKIIMESHHPLWQTLRPKLTVKELAAEATASIIWQALEDIEKPPLMWNAFPFHPMLADKPLSNRMPTQNEVSQAINHFEFFQTHFPLTMIVAVGNNADRALSIAGIPHKRVRHPSRGGKKQFTEGLQSLLL